MAVAKISSLELKLDLLKTHNPPSKQNANDRTAPIRASIFMVVFWFDVFSLPNDKSCASTDRKSSQHSNTQTGAKK
jgi:hypothetical protein